VKFDSCGTLQQICLNLHMAASSMRPLEVQNFGGRVATQGTTVKHKLVCGCVLLCVAVVSVFTCVYIFVGRDTPNTDATHTTDLFKPADTELRLRSCVAEWKPIAQMDVDAEESLKATWTKWDQHHLDSGDKSARMEAMTRATDEFNDINMDLLSCSSKKDDCQRVADDQFERVIEQLDEVLKPSEHDWRKHKKIVEYIIEHQGKITYFYAAEMMQKLDVHKDSDKVQILMDWSVKYSQQLLESATRTYPDSVFKTKMDLDMIQAKRELANALAQPSSTHTVRRLMQNMPIVI